MKLLGGGLNPRFCFDKSKIPTVHILYGIILFPQYAVKKKSENNYHKKYKIFVDGRI